MTERERPDPTVVSRPTLVDAPEGLRRQEQPRRRGGCGCWLLAGVTLLLTVGLVIAGLLLPPFNLLERLQGVEYTLFSEDNNAVSSDEGGLTLLVDPQNPGDEFGIALAHGSEAEILAPESAVAGNIKMAYAALPETRGLVGSIYAVNVTGTPPDRTSLMMNLPDDVDYNPDLIDLYGYNRDQNSWDYLAAQFVDDESTVLNTYLDDLPDQLAVLTASTVPGREVLVSVDVTTILTPEIAELATIVAPAGLTPTLEGTLTGSLAAGFDLNAGYRVMPVLRNFIDPRAIDTETVTAIMGNSQRRAEHVAQITAFASGGYDGVFIDYRDLPTAQRDNFSSFVAELSASLAGQGLLLGVVVPEAEIGEGVWQTGAYDWRELGASADFVEITFGLDPSIFTPGGNRPVEAMLRWGVGEVNRDKILIGLSAQSVRQTGADFTPIGYDEALAALGDVELELDLTETGTVLPGQELRARLNGMSAALNFDDATQTRYLDYLDDAGAPVARMWLTTPESLRFRMERTEPFALGGVAFNDILTADVPSIVYDAILNYKTGDQPENPPQSRELALRWRIEGTDGVVGEATTDLNDDLVATIEAPNGNYAVNVQIIGGDGEVPRGGAAVAVFAPTNTPTPIPTATPTPTPEAEEEADEPEEETEASDEQLESAPANSAAAVPNAPPVVNPVGPGSIAGGTFEYGGHVTTASTSAAGYMRGAGMRWMKVQIGMGQDAGAMISAAHGQGFKILLGIVGDPGRIPDGDPYFQAYASYVGQVAALGPDAIEVWNEPNIDREWPAGQISGATYTRLLQQSYNAIKAANPSVMVISGAPAPTGAQAAFPGRVINDDNWLREFVAAGGLNYTDCVGAHYNEGIVGPSQGTGDPRDGYYTRYFPGMLNTYWSIVGGQRPICFTELGYLSPEGFGSLPGGFTWAQNVTVAQQAAWLAEAAAIASQSGRVRLMIIWNIDFKRFDSDPMAGYAIIRPDGSCPACNSLAAAR